MVMAMVRVSGYEYYVRARELAREVLEKVEPLVEGTPCPDRYYLSIRNKALSVLERLAGVVDCEANKKYLQRLYYEAKALHVRVFGRE